MSTSLTHLAHLALERMPNTQIKKQTLSEPKLSVSQASNQTRKHVTNACQNCKRQHLKCSYEHPCQNCKSKGIECFKTERKTRKRGSKNATKTFLSQENPNSSAHSSGDERNEYSSKFATSNSPPSPTYSDSNSSATCSSPISESHEQQQNQQQQQQNLLPSISEIASFTSRDNHGIILGSCYWTRENGSQDFHPSWANGLFLEIIQKTGAAEQFSKLTIQDLFQGDYPDSYRKKVVFKSFSKEVKVAVSAVDSNTLLTYVYNL